VATKSLALSTQSLRQAADKVNALYPAANAGDRDATKELRQVLDQHPELWNSIGDLGKQAELALVEAAVGDGTFVKTAVMKKLDDLRLQLLAESASPIERLLVDRVAVTWLGLVIAEGAYYRSLTGGLDQHEDEWHQKRVERAQRRHLAAVKVLGQVRKLGAPVVQVNIAEKQINLAS
jgi:hypothetical protein